MSLNQMTCPVFEITSLTGLSSIMPGHTEHFRTLTELLLYQAWEYGILPAEQECEIPLLSQLAVYHDMGKLRIPERLLSKCGKLSDDEFEIVRSHTVLGAEIVESMHELPAPMRAALRDICLHHHERWDGGGYPDHLQGSRIAPCVQVIGLADAYDALMAPRCYKAALRPGEAEEFILSGACGAFSPELLKAFEDCADFISQEIYRSEL